MTTSRKKPAKKPARKPKKVELKEQDKFYIREHRGVASITKLATILGVPREAIAAYIKELEHPPARRVSDDTFGGRQGMAVMTKEGSEIGDEHAKHHSGKRNTEFFDRMGDNIVIPDPDKPSQ